MKLRRVVFDLIVYESMHELEKEDQVLMHAAVKARNNAYSPYSKFKVGAAVLLDNDEIIIGNNQENASYPSGLCAERVALFYASAKFPGIGIKTIAISATSKNFVVDRPAAPCGNCRQSISEYEIRQSRPIAIIMSGETGEILKCTSVSDILPLAFNGTFLG
ncbi:MULTISPECIES: cytidine deaminase [unclassified Arenibacter]|jgi:cytidine deaminase|uniref:cytidine deaminase n=1 Tax=unclassified Arenibacter TaxID=2615047 RepID=UPI000E353F92|nr:MULTISPECIES: cytidine deaminase [unclassified Arenibacter]MCM4164444.1 cytidine deaminase [Arenibacter sp. A80]RFT56215.1 cytidine deaminase [Arenibacter sp. P308M17]